MTKKNLKKKLFRVAQKVALFNKKNQVLILRFSKEKSLPKLLHGKWDFPGGGLEWSESLKAGLDREIKEEIGQVKVKISEPLLLWDWVQATDSRVKTVCVLYKGTFVSGEIILSNEHDQYCWATISDLSQKYFAWDKDMIKRLVKILKR